MTSRQLEHAPKGDLLRRELDLDPEKVVDQADQTYDPEEVYRRFSPRKKQGITALTAAAAFLAPVASASFLPSIPQIARDMKTTSEVVNYSVSVYLVVLGVAPLIWAPCSGYYGRRPIYLASIPIFFAASLGCGFSRTLGQLIACRVLQAFGSSSVLSVGAGTIGDIYAPTTRASAMGVFYLGVLVGPTLAPSIAGLLGEYTPEGWRATQYLLAALGGFSLCLIFFFLPETWHGPTPHTLAKARLGKRFVFFWFNPFRAVALLRFLNILLISLNSSFVLLTTYVLQVPLANILAPRYGISNVALIGVLYLPQGVGNLVGSRIGGLYADHIVRRWIAKRGYRRPEDRLYSTLIGGGLLTPGALLAIGWIIQSGKGGLAPPLIMYGVSGVGLMLILSSSNTYLVDCLQSRSAEVIAINNCLRYIAAAGASAGILPLVNAIGVGPAHTIAAGIALLGFACVLATIRWGERMSGRAVPASAPTAAVDIAAVTTTTTVATPPLSVISFAETLAPLARKDGAAVEGVPSEEALARTASIHRVTSL